MKISLLIDALGAGGAQRQLVGLACLLKEANYEVEIVTYHYMEFYDSILQEAGVPHILAPGSENKKRRIWAIGRYLKKSKPNIVIAYQAAPSQIASIIKLFNHNFKLIVSERNTNQTYSKADMLRFNLYRLADYVVPNSYSQGEFIIKHASFLRDKMCVITNYVDTKKFHPTSVYCKRANQQPIKLLTYGRITPQKNILNYIKAIKSVRRQGYNVQVDWYGYRDRGGVYGEVCDALIDELSMKDSFRFHEPVNDVVSGYNSCTAFVLPSFFEGTPNVVCEAMSCGVPILCSNVCDNSRLVSYTNGRLFDPNNIDDIVEKIIVFCNLPEDFKSKMARASRSIAEANFESSQFLNKYINLIN